MTAATGVREAPTNVGADVGAGRRGASVEDARGGHAARYVWAVLRLLMGWTFFWAFIDKLFGLGFATAAESSWLNVGLGTNLRFGPPVGSDAPRPPVPDPPIDRLVGPTARIGAM